MVAGGGGRGEEPTKARQGCIHAPSNPNLFGRVRIPPRPEGGCKKWRGGGGEGTASLLLSLYLVPAMLDIPAVLKLQNALISKKFFG
jgi:hypothetical protein